MVTTFARVWYYKEGCETVTTATTTGLQTQLSEESDNCYSQFSAVIKT